MAVNVVNTYRAASYDTQFACFTGSGACGVILSPATVLADGFTVQVWDAGSNAGTNNITVAAADGALINGKASLTISNNGGAVHLVKNGNTWSGSSSFETVDQGASPNISPLWVVQAVTTSSVLVNPGTTYLACNFAGTITVNLPASTTGALVYGRPLFIQNQANTGNTTTNYVRIVGGNASTSVNGTNADITISTALGGKTLIPASNGWWTY